LFNFYLIYSTFFIEPQNCVKISSHAPLFERLRINLLVLINIIGIFIFDVYTIGKFLLLV